MFHWDKSERTAVYHDGNAGERAGESLPKGKDKDRPPSGSAHEEAEEVCAEKEDPEREHFRNAHRKADGPEQHLP